MEKSIARAFRRYMLQEHMPRIRRCAEMLSEEEVRRKPSPHGNSVANLLLHLAGNVRQWIFVGIGGATDQRERAAEFAATSGESGAGATELCDRLEQTVREAVEIVEAATPEQLLREYLFQGRFRGDGVLGVLHVLEHFSGHAGQIYAWTKQVKGVDLKFYDL